jgi:hypothetical protein
MPSFFARVFLVPGKGFTVEIPQGKLAPGDRGKEAIWPTANSLVSDAKA